jgi:hypothetical protein
MEDDQTSNMIPHRRELDWFPPSFATVKVIGALFIFFSTSTLVDDPGSARAHVNPDRVRTPRMSLARRHAHMVSRIPFGRRCGWLAGRVLVGWRR